MMNHYFYSGLLAAKAWGEVWPNMRENILITSSAFRASVKVITQIPSTSRIIRFFAQIYGMRSEDRALPVQRCPVQLAYSSEECVQVGTFRGSRNAIIGFTEL